MNDRYHLLSFDDVGQARAGLLVGERVYPYGPQLGEALGLDMHDLTVADLIDLQIVLSVIALARPW